jgi:conjugal transfer/type IV secretion protein DotA/TraY
MITQNYLRKTPTWLLPVILMLLALASMSVPSLAFAQAAANGAIESASQITSLGGQVSAVAPDTDYSIGLLKLIFGDMNALSTADTPLGNAMSKYNAGVMLLAAAVFLFTALMFPIKSAEDGELFGRWNTVFVPFRMVVATLLLFPAASGFSFGQVANYWLVQQSVGLANVVSGAMVEGFTNKAGSSLTAQSANSSQIQGLATQIFLANACVAAIKDREGNANYDIGLHYSQKDKSYNWGPGIEGSGLDSNYCGSLQIAEQGIASNTGIGGAGISGLSSFFPSGSQKAITAAANGYQSSMIVNMDNQLKGLAESVVSSIKPAGSGEGMSIDDGVLADNLAKTTPAKIAQIAVSQTNDATQEFNRLLALSVDAAGEYGSDMKQQIISKGWIATGGWMYQIAALQSYYNSIFNEFPQVTPGKYYTGTANVNQIDAELLKYASKIADPAAISALAADMNGNSYFGSAAGTGTSLTRGFAQKIGFDPNSHNHPLIQLQNGGSMLEGIGLGQLAARAIVSKYINSDNTVTAEGKTAILVAVGGNLALQEIIITIIEAASELLPIIAYILLGAGIVLSVVLPLLPLIHWLGGILGWFISVFVLILATPVWVASHMFPEGHDIAGRGGPGYMLLLQALLTPVLMVFGFLGGFLICYPILMLLNSMFFFVIDSIDAANISGIFTFLVSVMVYVGFCYYAVSRCFDLISVVPDKALAAIGGRGDQLDDHHGNKAAILGVVRQGTNQLSRDLGAGARAARARDKATKDQASKITTEKPT